MKISVKHFTIKTTAILMLSFFTLPNAHAEKWANQFTEFELPPRWMCLLEGAEWVCQSQEPTKKKDAIIILAAKMQGDQDTLDQYLKYLQQPKHYTTPQGKSVTSQVRYARNKTIQDHPWVDSLHMESEVPGFYTRYLATVKDGIGILVTYSVNKNKYAEYQDLFEAMVNSLKVFRRPGGLNAAPATSDLFKNTKIPSGITDDSVFPVVGSSDAQQKVKKNDLAALLDDPMVFGGGVAAIGLILVMLLKRLRKKK